MATEQTQIAKAADVAARFANTSPNNLQMNKIIVEKCLGEEPFTFMLFKKIWGFFGQGILVSVTPETANLVSKVGVSPQVTANSDIAEYCANSDCQNGTQCAAKRLRARK